MKIITIKHADGSVYRSWPIDSDVIQPAVEIEAKLHNRDFPDDPWIVEISDD